MVRSYQLPSSFSLLHSFCSSSVTLNASLTCHTIFNHLLMEVKFCLTIGVEEVTTKALLQIPMTFIMHFTLCQPTDIYILEVLSCFFWYLSTLLLLTSLLKRHLSLKGTRGHNQRITLSTNATETFTISCSLERNCLKEKKAFQSVFQMS